MSNQNVRLPNYKIPSAILNCTRNYNFIFICIKSNLIAQQHLHCYPTMYIWHYLLYSLYNIINLIMSLFGIISGINVTDWTPVHGISLEAHHTNSEPKLNWPWTLFASILIPSRFSWSIMHWWNVAELA